ncbi:hypothetical protein LTR56_004244 [Elasticomyces elasticus]|nr:hypothetical protein LTR56_004244 [Elasticomyces elasticus]KAK3655133.1 hypothetical protein LTR22_010443 [Elasticomyces elasticus]KAK4907718.1 hypothetical protein LTR49_023314 [Elasticomyces elasticus]KAK5750581.1 hypothetical protein LTS12_019371 [Elasticomyces elasticus]
MAHAYLHTSLTMSECSGSISYIPPAISKPRQVTPEATSRQLIPVIYTSEQSHHERLASLKLENKQMRQTNATLHRQNTHLLEKGRGLARRASDRISKLKEKNRRLKGEKKALRLINESHERDLDRLALLCSGYDTLKDDHRKLQADYLATSCNEESLKVELERWPRRLMVYFEGAPPDRYNLIGPDGTLDEHTLDEHMEWKVGELARLSLGGWLVQSNEEVVGAAGDKGVEELKGNLEHLGFIGFGTKQWCFETQEQQAKKASE